MTHVHPDPQPTRLGWGRQASFIHEAETQTGRAWGLAPNPRLGQEENCLQQERTLRVRNPHRMGIERKETPRGSPPQAKHPGTQVPGSIPTHLGGAQVPFTWEEAKPH